MNRRGADPDQSDRKFLLSFRDPLGSRPPFLSGALIVKAILLLALALVGVARAATKYPFPYFAEYPYGSRPNAVAASTATSLQMLYDDWKAAYYEESGDKARVKWADTKASGACNSSGNCTVSEGIGYGMLITVYMDNATNNTKGMFDKLWKYYQANLDNKGLMNWQINGFGGATQTGGATDADLDVTLALCMAYKQWGDAAYLDAAKSMLGKIWSSEIDGGKLLKPGSQFSSPYNPSYLAIGALRVFAAVDASHDWKGAADANLALVQKNQNSTTGLNSDWCNGSGQPQDYNGTGTTKFGFDAVRTPWRVVLDYLWFGTATDVTVLGKINTWIKTKTGSAWIKVKAEWALDGSSSASYTNSLYLGAFAVTGMVNPGDTTWMRQGTAAIIAKDPDMYYNDSWRILYLLTLMGNFQNLWGTVKPVGISAPASHGAAGWTVAAGKDRIALDGRGFARVELRDLRGTLLQDASGADHLELVRPAAPGIYVARIQGSSSLQSTTIVVP